MERGDVRLIEEMSQKDQVLAALYKEHVDLEKKLDKIERKPYLSPTEIVEKKNLQKQKLRGKDQIERILTRYKQGK